MRMWMVNPRLMCREHLLGEHVELHMFVAQLKRGLNLAGYFEKRLLEVHSIARRHAQLAAEMRRRGYRHRSPLPSFRQRRAGRVDRRANQRELAARCVHCRHLQQAGGWRGHPAATEDA
jgi:ribosomal protein L44E